MNARRAALVLALAALACGNAEPDPRWEPLRVGEVEIQLTGHYDGCSWQPFDRAQWKSAATWSPTRLLMLRELLETHLRVGADRRVIEDALGPKDRELGTSTEPVSVYFLGYPFDSPQFPDSEMRLEPSVLLLRWSGDRLSATEVVDTYF